ncbi:MAG: response regulator transcription factor [Anaerolineae bacterium]|nr:response regulator transcription factor [Anaerolineae bacterium]
MLMAVVVVIEDDPLIYLPLSEALREHGYTVFTAADGKAGLEAVFTYQPHVVILDILLPEMDGWAVCKAIRRSSVVPILMLSSLNEEIDRILGLELGADDYLTKPFSTRELIAHIRALLRRVEFSAPKSSANHLNFDRISIDLGRRIVIKDGQEIALRYKAFELLALLAANAGQVVTRADIFDKIWGTDWIGDTRTLEVHIRWLREQLEDDPSHPQFIQTARSAGYRFAGSPI